MGGKNKKKQNKYNKEYYIVLAMLGVLLTALIIGIAIQQSRPYTVAKLISEFEKLDKEYSASWKKEKISGMIVSLDKIDPYIEELNEIEEKIKKQEKTKNIGVTDTKTLLINLTQARILMLESEKKYQEFQALGDAGRIDFYYIGTQAVINESINCNDKLFLIKGADLLNQSLIKAQQTIQRFDYVFENSEQLRSIGTKQGKQPDSRLEFYKISLADKIKTPMDINLIVANNICKNF